MANELLTVKEVADILKCHVNTVRRLIRQGDVPGVWIGKKGKGFLRVRKTDLDNLINKKGGLCSTSE